MKDQFVEEQLSNGNTIKYRVLESGTAYHADTHPDVVRTLENARIRGTRIRVYYGDTATGRDWDERYHVLGRIGRSTGRFKILILLHNRTSLGGAVMLDHCIVRVEESRGKRLLYSHPSYHKAA